ncbi:MAG: BlaI/MecI/CopY family transcriptional regulator [Acidobacteriota bacterium]
MPESAAPHAESESAAARPNSLEQLSRRERQIMDILYRLEAPSAADVRAEMADPPSYSAVRSALSLLVDRGLVAHSRDGQRYLYRPTVPKKKARRSMLRHVLETFFEGSRPQAALALLDDQDLQLSGDEYARLRGLLDEARERGGRS